MQVYGRKLLYIGDTEDKDQYVDHEGLEALSLVITEHSKLPDVIISDEAQGWLFLIEVVTSHGPVSAKRMVELEEFTNITKVAAKHEKTATEASLLRFLCGATRK